MKRAVLDCDGVLVDYNSHFGEIYRMAFKKQLNIINPRAYHATEYWGVTLSKEEKQKFYAYFDKFGWGTMPALKGAVESTHALKAHGYEIIVVTSMNERASQARMDNLHSLGVVFDDFYATGRVSREKNPKEKILNDLMPEWFVDDLITNFVGLHSNIKCALIDSDLHGNPNQNLKHQIPHHGAYSSLHHFVKENF